MFYFTSLPLIPPLIYLRHTCKVSLHLPKWYNPLSHLLTEAHAYPCLLITYDALSTPHFMSPLHIITQRMLQWAVRPFLKRVHGHRKVADGLLVNTRISASPACGGPNQPYSASDVSQGKQPNGKSDDWKPLLRLIGQRRLGYNFHEQHFQSPSEWRCHLLKSDGLIPKFLVRPTTSDAMTINVSLVSQT
jgi:hypothetical protein